MARYFYIKFSDQKKAKRIKYPEYVALFQMARYYDAIVREFFHPRGKTLVVNFPKHFV